MTSINTSLNAYAMLGSAYANSAQQNSLVSVLAANDADSAASSTSSATNLTLSDAARAKLAAASSVPDFTTVTTVARTTLDTLYTAAKVTGPLDKDGKTTIDLSSLDRRSLFAIATNSGAKFTSDEQSVAARELKSRFDAALAPAAATTGMTDNYTVVYKAALDYLDAASDEEKATATWGAQHSAALKGYQAAQQDPATAPSGIANDPVATYLAQNPNGATSADASASFGTVASNARAALDAQAKAAAANGKELVYDPGRKTGQLADFSSFDNRTLSAIVLNQGAQFSNLETFAAKQELGSRTRASLLSALTKSQSSGDPSQFSLAILQNYSGMSDEERQANNWTTSFRDTAIQNYKTTTSLLSMLQG